MALAIMNTQGHEPVELSGVGIVTDAGVPLERAAESMSELQDGGVPLSGAELEKAAREWVAAYPTLTISDVEGSLAPEAPVAPAVPVAVEPVVEPVVAPADPVSA